VELRLTVPVLSNAHIVQCHRWERQDAGVHVSVHNDLFAEDAACPLLELYPEVGPVNEEWRKQSRKKRHHEKTTSRQ
jgi:hypothetical protein